MIRRIVTLQAPDSRPKRFPRSFALVLGLLLALGACGEDEKGAPPASAPAGPGGGGGPPPGREPPLRPLPELPAGPRSPEGDIRFYADLLEGGDEERLRWAWDQLDLAGSAAAAQLSERLETALARNPFFAENILVSFGRGVNGSSALARIVRACSHEDGRLRLAAAKALGGTGSAEAIPPLLDLLDDDFDAVAHAATEALDRLGTEEAFRGLMGRFPDRLSPGALSKATSVLGGRLPSDEARRFLLATLAKEDIVLAVSAARALADRGFEDTFKAIRSRLRPELDGITIPRRRFAVSQALAKARDPELLPRLVEESASPKPAVAADALRLLGDYRGEEARAAMWRAVAGRRGDLRREALHALYRSGEPEALAHISKLLESEASEDRYDAALLLGLIREPESAPALEKALEKETDLGSRVKIAHALALIGRPGTSAEVVRTLLEETNPDPGTAFLATHVSDALMRFPELPAEDLATLAKAAGSPNPAIRLNVARILGVKGRTARERDALARLLRDPSEDVRRMAVRAWLVLRNADLDTLLSAYREEPLEQIAKLMYRAALQLVHRWER